MKIMGKHLIVFLRIYLGIACKKVGMPLPTSFYLWLADVDSPMDLRSSVS